MSDSLASFAALFRPVLILLGEDAPITKLDGVRSTVRLLGLDGAPFERIFELRAKEGSSLREPEANNLFAAYMVQIERVIKAVNAVKHDDTKHNSLPY